MRTILSALIGFSFGANIASCIATHGNPGIILGVIGGAMAFAINVFCDLRNIDKCSSS